MYMHAQERLAGTRQRKLEAERKAEDDRLAACKPRVLMLL
jgi:hypothetical protein